MRQRDRQGDRARRERVLISLGLLKDKPGEPNKDQTVLTFTLFETWLSDINYIDVCRIIFDHKSQVFLGQGTIEYIETLYSKARVLSYSGTVVAPASPTCPLEVVGKDGIAVSHP